MCFIHPKQKADYFFFGHKKIDIFSSNFNTISSLKTTGSILTMYSIMGNITE